MISLNMIYFTRFETEASLFNLDNVKDLTRFTSKIFRK